MQNHTKIYFAFFGYTIADWIMCEVPGCGQGANAVHHIDARGMGGDKHGKKDVITNLMAVCQACHEKYGDREQYMEFLMAAHYEILVAHLKKTNPEVDLLPDSSHDMNVAKTNAEVKVIK
jgi:hypothetical protein